MKQVLVCVLVAVLSACLDQSRNDDTTPSLLPIGSQRVVAGETLQFTVNGGAIAISGFSSDGTTGPENNPYTQSVPAEFDVATATFTWTPSDAEAGVYSVQFKYTYPDEPTRTVTETVMITVIAAHKFGGELFARLCVDCHGAEASGGSARSILKATAEDIEQALSSVTEMRSLSSELPLKDARYIAQHLEYLLTQARAHLGVDASTECFQCHNDFNATGKSALHLPTSDLCGVCHQITAWNPVVLLGFMHRELITPMDCTICHMPIFRRI